MIAPRRLSALFLRLSLLCLLLLLSAPAAQSQSFSNSQLSGENLNNPTALCFGPDNRLYVAQQNGRIFAYRVSRTGDDAYQITSTETIDLIQDIPNHNDDGSDNPSVDTRQLTGMAAGGTPANPVLYVSSSDPRIEVNNTDPPANSLDTNSGMVSRLRWDGAAWTKLDLVRGLPRSEENHASNGLALDESTQTLYLAQGGHTNQGAPSTNFSRLTEYALSGAILSIDLTAIGETTYDLPTLDDEDRAGSPDFNDPFGGNDGKNQAMLVPGGPVQVYAPGFRNPFDVCLTQAGRLYTCDNGPNSGWGGEIQNCSNDFNDGGSTYEDNLHYISGPGYYGGHPNATRADTGNTFNDSDPQSPVSAGNPVECDYRIPGTEDGALTTFARSTNGLCEYTATNFGGAMQGDLVLAGFTGDLWRAQLTAAGDALTTPPTSMASGFGNQPLGVDARGDEQTFPGTIWVTTRAAGNVVVFEPSDYDDNGVTPCSGAYDLTDDDDGDGFSNGQELDAGTHPCDPSDAPTAAPLPARRHTLAQNVPNPFNPRTRLGFTLETGAPVRLDVLDAVGRALRVLVDQPMAAGSHSIVWDGTDAQGKDVASGAYFYRLTVQGESLVRRMVLVR